MNDFKSQLHYVPLAADKVAGILGWGFNESADGDTYLIDKDGVSHWTLKMLGEDRGAIVDIMPGQCRSRGAKQIARVFGDTALAGHQKARIMQALTDLGILVTRTVLVEAEQGDEIWGTAVTSHTDIRIERADGLVINTMDVDDSRPFKGEVVKLTTKTYETISDAVWNDPDAYDEAFAGIIQVMPGMLQEILQSKAIGNVHVWGVLDGPLATSQTVMCRDHPYHVAPAGFIGQFAVPGRAAVWNFIASQVNGRIVFERHAL